MNRLTFLFACALLTACRHDPGFDGVRTPLWISNGTQIVHAQRPQADRPQRFDLYLDNSQGMLDERLLKRVEPASLSDRSVRGDGRYLACLTGKREVKDLSLVDLHTGDTRTLLDGIRIRPGTLAWEPDGRRLAFTLAMEPTVGFIDSTTWAFSRQPLETPLVCDWLRGGDGRLLLASDHPAGEGNMLVAWQPGSQTPPAIVYRTEGPGIIHSARSDPAGQWIAVIMNLPQTSGINRSNLVLTYPARQWQRVVWESPRPLVGLRWSPDNQAVYVSQLGREDGSGWTVHRIGLKDLSPTPMVAHRAGWDLAPDGRRAVLAEGRSLRVTAIPASP